MSPGSSRILHGIQAQLRSGAASSQALQHLHATVDLSNFNDQLPNTGFSQSGLRRAPFSAHALVEMGLPIEPVTLTVAQMEDLNRKLAVMRHDINNNLSLIVAALELIRHKPQMSEQMMTTLGQQPAKIGEAMNKFSADFERSLGITRP